MIKPFLITSGFTALCLATAPLQAQSATLGVSKQDRPSEMYRYHQPRRDEQGMVRLEPGIAIYNPLAVIAPPPREFAQNDLVTIIVRESIETDLENELNTEVKTTQSASVDSVPYLDDFLNTPLNLGLNSNQKYEGDGDKSNSNSVTTRIQARIAEVLPNGDLVLEARKLLQHDEELHEMLLSGVCRAQDITGDNTVLSSQIYRLTVRQITQGALKDAAKKGWITRIFDTVFSF